MRQSRFGLRSNFRQQIHTTRPRTLTGPSTDPHGGGNGRVLYSQTMIQDAFFISGFLLVVGLLLVAIAWGSWGGEL